MKNLRVLFFVILLIFADHHAVVAGSTFPDSAMREKEKAWSFKSKARLHTRGMFAYGGRVASKHPAIDINLSYNRKQWGFLVFKATDMMDRTSANNFSLAVFYKNFKLGKQLTITPHLGAFLEQPHHFAGHGSDVAIINITTFKLNSHLSVEHTTLFGNMLIEPSYRDWVNRFRLLFTHKHLDIIAALWHNNQVFDQADYLSSGLQVMYSRIKLSDDFNLSVGVTELSVLHSSNENMIAKDHQLLTTLAIQFVR